MNNLIVRKVAFYLFTPPIIMENTLECKGWFQLLKVDISFEKVELHLFSRTTLILIFGVLILLITSTLQKFSA